MSALPHPYRTAERASQPQQARPVDPLWAAERGASHFVVGWALLRVAVCSARGMDFEGFVALAIVVTAVASLTRSFA
jgi:hypothetical protein